MKKKQSIAWSNILFWTLLGAVVLGVRLYLVDLLPTYLWSKDTGSYVRSASHWLQTGHWETDPRRGPVYSMFIAGCLRVWGDFNAVVAMQHLLGAVAVLAAVAVLRRMQKSASWLALFLCSYALAVNGGVLHMGQMIRNETLLLFFATSALSCWWAALRTGNAIWLFCCGLATALLALTKNIFAPLPLLVTAMAIWHYRAVWRRAILHISLFLLGIGIVSGGASLVKPKTTEPQQGYLLYARVAQFTVLDGGIEPEIKALIRPDIEAYRQLGRLDNNLILKRTAVPKINQHLRQHGKTMADANALCMRLALEAIRANPSLYAKQVLGDLSNLLFKNAKQIKKPDQEDIAANLTLLTKELQTKEGVPWQPLPQSIAASERAASPGFFKLYHLLTGSSWLFTVAPVFITTLLIPVFIWLRTGTERLWWLGLGILWGFTIVLLCTVGRPMDRYLLPVLPIMFWTLSYGFLLLWDFAKSFGTKPAISPDSQAHDIAA